MCVCVIESEEEEAEEEQVETHTSPEPAQDNAPYYEPPPVRYVHVHAHMLLSDTHAHFGYTHGFSPMVIAGSSATV